MPKEVKRSEQISQAKKGWLPPGGYTQANAWALENRAALEDYATRIATYGTAADELEQYLTSQSAAW